ncbi:transcription factor bHLH74 [Punica granatum]|uniref:Transcription factor bHLH74 n=1 Tax=Punica granatum TaxID=22663 RepID=A0A218X7I8_PUNGR|nr:transcription factor bHLH74 [Punica granatum]OWM80626.1 hypothetical protein CDL15_Pgr006656 [Punica granatum]
MEACDGGDMGFQQVGNAVTNRESNPISQEASMMAMSSMAMIPKPANVHHDPFFGFGWDPLSSMTQNHQNFGCPPVVPHRDFASFPFPPLPLWENQGIPPHLAHYPPPDSSFIDMVPRAPCFVSRGLSDMVGPVGLPQSGPVANPGPNYASNVGDSAIEGTRNTEGEAMGSPSTERRRKRTPDSSSPYDPNKNTEGEPRQDHSGDTSDVQKDQNEKKQKIEQTESANSRGKQTKDDSNSQEPPKENYIHVRARRGQATNSHSLAERVRREKISERMRMLQELVPGCNKITGKAVMLDEIINYVQSLQQQVEFLSMKLATLLPDLSIDLERVLSKEILQARGRDALARGLGPGTGLPLPYSNAPGILQGALPSTSQYPPLPQGPLDNELQTLFQMGFDSNSAHDLLKQNGRLKPEQ